jgi:hypothetical protein
VTCSLALVGHACRRPGAVCPNLRYTWVHHRAVHPFVLRRSFWPWRCIHANPLPSPMRRPVVPPTLANMSKSFGSSICVRLSGRKRKGRYLY